MTIGERIAKIRKENNLSQEAFGEALGVTRQAISKWEADANIPDVDKLMTMSRLYGVSVGYILGMEEEKAATEGACETRENLTSDGSPRQLTEEQILMVEEIVKRYLEALPKAEDREAEGDSTESGAQTHDSSPRYDATDSHRAAKPKKRWRLWKVLAVAAVIGLVIYFQSTIRSLKNQYQNLQSNLYRVQHALDNQSANLSYQIKEILESQNNLLVDSGYEITGYDLAAETITLSLYAEPKIYAPGMKIYFGTDSDGQELTVEGTADGHRYSAQITCALTDSISMFVRVERDGVIETQIMDYLGGMRYASVPSFAGTSVPHLWGDAIGTETTRIQEVLIAWFDPEEKAKIGDARVAEIVSVLYVNYQEYQVFSMTPDEGKYVRPEDDSDGRAYYSAQIEVDVPLQEGDEVTFTTRVTDTYGREFEEIDKHYVVRNGEFELDDYPEIEELRRAE